MSTISLIFLLLSNAVNTRRDKSILYSRTIIIIVLYSLLVIFKTINLPFLGEGIGLFGGLFHATPLTQVFHLFLFSISAVIMHLTAFYPRKLLLEKYSGLYHLLSNYYMYKTTNIVNRMAQQFKIIEYPLILLFILTGSLLLISSSDVVSIFLSIELQSYGLYLLAALYRNSELSTSAGLTYFLLGGLSSCFILLGTSLFYANSGTTSLDGYYVITAISNTANDNAMLLDNWYSPIYLNISLLIMSVGFLFKISAAPFHFWSPDVYDAIPTIVTTFVAVTAKISILVFMLELVHYASDNLSGTSFSWTFSLLLSSLLSFLVGTVLGLTQTRIKRLFAYSTISHVGFILLALTINTLESIQAFIFYLMQYSMSNLNAFLILLAIGYSLYPYIHINQSQNQTERKQVEREVTLDKDNSPIQYIAEIKGYFEINPTLALSLAITLFSFVGIPPLIGFFAKQMVLSAALDSGYIFITIIAILTSVISASYYLTVVKQIFFDKNEHHLSEEFKNVLFDYKMIPFTPVNTNNVYGKFSIGNVTLSGFLSLSVSLLTLTVLLFMFGSNEWLSMTKLLSLMIFNP